MNNLVLRQRPRRLRSTEAIRQLSTETRLSAQQFIQPLFVCQGTAIKKEISSLPGQFHLSKDFLYIEVEKAVSYGINTILLFPVVPNALKDAMGTVAFSPDFYLYKILADLRKKFPYLNIAVDLALDPFTTHGHDGVLDKEGRIANDATVEILAKIAILQAKSGANIIAPSDMMDGRIGFIRDALDAKGFNDVLIMAYSAKYASAFYGPFRDALSSQTKGDKKSYQMNPANSREAIKEVLLDVAEGADIVMIKPALAYLDIIAKVKEHINLPLAAYNVSGEYAMLKAAAEKGWLDYEKCLVEIFTAFNRAGADIIISYSATSFAEFLFNSTHNLDLGDGKQRNKGNNKGRRT